MTTGLAAIISLKTSNKIPICTSALLSCAALVANYGTRYFLKRSGKDEVNFSFALRTYLIPLNIIGGVAALTTLVYSSYTKQLPKVLQGTAYGFGTAFFINLIGDLVYIFFDRNPTDKF